MNAKDAIRAAQQLSDMVLSRYLDDLGDADLMLRPAPGCNHLAWQLGHLINSESRLLDYVAPGTGAKLPDGFAERHSKENAGDDTPEHFCKKQEYLDLFQQVHAATLSQLDKLSEDDLDRPGPEHFRNLFPTVGHIFVLMATHGLMHAGQFVPVRRALGKPITI
jgi:hypothetical protein